MLREANQLISDEDYITAYNMLTENNLSVEGLESSGYDYTQFELLFKINQYIEKEEFSEAVHLIEQNDLLNKDLLYEKYNFNDIITYFEFLSMYELSDGFLRSMTSKYFTISDEYVRGKLMELDPVYNFLNSNNLDMELIEEYKGARQGDMTFVLSDKNLESSYLNDEGFSSFLIMDDEFTVIETGSYYITKIFRIFDKDGNAARPEVLMEFDAEKAIGLREQWNKQVSEFERKEQEKENAKKVKIGMDYDEVISRWGEPDRIRKTTTKYGVSEQWVYPHYKYVYFEDGLVRAIQE